MEICEACGFGVLLTFPIFKNGYVIFVCRDCHEDYKEKAAEIEVAKKYG